LEKNFVEESFPFDNSTLVFKVHNKIFALLGLEEPNFLNLKCDPERALNLREKHTEIKAGYHMNKKHWNTLDLNAFLSKDLILELIDHSYELIWESLPKRIRENS
jgi:predicted DNA-binding protein (MmcQ/YjbR family)